MKVQVQSKVAVPLLKLTAPAGTVVESFAVLKRYWKPPEGLLSVAVSVMVVLSRLPLPSPVLVGVQFAGAKTSVKPVNVLESAASAGEATKERARGEARIAALAMPDLNEDARGQEDLDLRVRAIR